MKRTINTLTIILLVVSLVVVSSCKRDNVGVPDPTGPSTLATLIELVASPNVIVAGDQRQDTTVNVRVFKYDGSPVANQAISFDIRDQLGAKLYLGFLDGNQTVVSKTTDSSGSVSVTYSGPLSSELSDLQLPDTVVVHINAYLGWQSDEIITDHCAVVVVGDLMDFANSIEFELQAMPNILWCTDKRPKSVIRGIFQYTYNGIPVIGRRIYFKILSGPGEFEDGRTKTFVVTDKDGVASIKYVGPTRDELDFDSVVTIQGQPETDWIHIDAPGYDDPPEGNQFYIHKELDIRLIKGQNNN
jgi:hypothetical protein